MLDSIDSKMLMSAASFLFTGYFWFVKARKERPNLEFYQLADYRVSLRKHPGKTDCQRLMVQQLDTGGVLIVNHSTRQNSVVLFDAFLKTDHGKIRGEWGYTGEDKPPWNIGPESTIAFSPACFFDVPSDFEVPDELEFTLVFKTASGKKFSHEFTRRAERFAEQESENPSEKKAA